MQCEVRMDPLFLFNVTVSRFRPCSFEKLALRWMVGWMRWRGPSRNSDVRAYLYSPMSPGKHRGLWTTGLTSKLICALTSGGWRFERIDLSHWDWCYACLQTASGYVTLTKCYVTFVIAVRTALWGTSSNKALLHVDTVSFLGVQPVKFKYSP